MIFFERDKFFAFLQLKAITLSVISIFKTLTQMKQQCHQDSTPLVFIRYKATKKAMDTIKYTSVHFNNKKLSFLFVSRCSHVWCRLQHFNCILLVFFRRWGQLVMRDLLKHDALLWLVVFSTALIGAFRSLLFTQWFAPLAVRCHTALLLLCFLVVGIHTSGIFIPLSLLMLLGWSLMWIASLTLRV